MWYKSKSGKMNTYTLHSVPMNGMQCKLYEHMYCVAYQFSCKHLNFNLILLNLIFFIYEILLCMDFVRCAKIWTILVGEKARICLVGIRHRTIEFSVDDIRMNRMKKGNIMCVCTGFFLCRTNRLEKNCDVDLFQIKKLL